METRKISHSFVRTLEAFNQGKFVYKAKHLHLLPHKDIKRDKLRHKFIDAFQAIDVLQLPKNKFVEILNIALKHLG